MSSLVHVLLKRKKKNFNEHCKLLSQGLKLKDKKRTTQWMKKRKMLRRWKN